MLPILPALSAYQFVFQFASSCSGIVNKPLNKPFGARIGLIQKKRRLEINLNLCQERT
jgi:hypothetical protein